MFFRKKISSLPEAMYIYRSFFGDKMPKKRSFALQEWNRFYLPLIEAAIENGDIDVFFSLLRDLPPSGAAKVAAEVAFDSFIPKICTAKQARDYRNRFFLVSDYRLGLFLEKVINRWNKLSIIEINNATTIDEIAIATLSSCYKSKQLGILKWIDACRTVRDIEELTNLSDPDKYLYSRQFDLKKVQVICREVPKVTDIKTIKNLYRLAPEKSSAKILVFEKWIELCTTLEQANEAFNNAPESEILCKLEAYKKLKELVDRSV